MDFGVGSVDVAVFCVVLFVCMQRCYFGSASSDVVEYLIRAFTGPFVDRELS